MTTYRQPEKRRTVAVDMDGVLHAYTGSWTGAHELAGVAVPGAIGWLNAITHTFDVAILSTRCASPEGQQAIREWLIAQGITSEALARISTPECKPPALVYLDDRAIRFTGENFPTVAEIRAARPWWMA